MAFLPLTLRWHVVCTVHGKTGYANHPEMVEAMTEGRLPDYFRLLVEKYISERGGNMYMAVVCEHGIQNLPWDRVILARCAGDWDTVAQR